MAKKSITPPDNVTIINPDTEETTTANDMTTPKETAPREIAKGYKACPACSEIIAARSMHCKHCGHDIPAKDPNAPKTAKAPRKAKTETPENPKLALLKVLKSRGFTVTGSQDIFDPTAEIEYTTEKAIAPILDYIPSYNRNGKFELDLDAMLTILKLPLRK